MSIVPEDSGTYTCRATNLLGTAEQTSYLSCKGKEKEITSIFKITKFTKKK